MTCRRVTVPRGEPLHHRGAGVVGVERLDRAGPRHPGDVAEVDDDEGERRQHQVVELGEEAGALRRQGEHREPAELDADEVLQRHAGHEVGDRRAGQAERDDRAVGDACCAAGRRTCPAAMAIGIVSTRPRAASLADRPSAGHSRSVTGTLVLERVAPVERDRALQQPPVLLEQRVVGAELLVQGVDRLLRGERPEDAAADVAGQHVDDQEDDRRQQEQREDRQQRPGG